MIDITHYTSRYRKDADADCMLYQTYNNAVLECAQNQIDDHADLATEDLAWSARSLLECKIVGEHDCIFMKEAILKTYPTKLLTKAVAKCLCKQLSIQQCLVSMSLQNAKFANDSQLAIYDLGIHKFIEWEPVDGTKFAAMLKCKCMNIEDDIAGRVVYTLGLVTRSKQPSIDAFSSAAQALIQCGQSLGYDYIAQTTQYNADSKILICQVIYESKFQDANIEVEDDLYHITPISTVGNILKFGLSPKSKTYIAGEKACHSDRVYLFNGFDKNAISMFARQLEKQSSQYDKLKKLLLQTKDYALLKIDKRKVPNLKLYRDNNFQAKDVKHPIALYTYSNIPPNAIELVDYAHMH